MQPTDLRARHLLGLTLAVLLCYANALGADFQFDDYRVIVNNPAVHSWAAWLDTEGQGLWGIRPLLKLSYVLNWVSGWGVTGFHLLNIGLHLANTWLVYRLVQHFGAALAGGPNWAQVPLASALLFALHPANTEAVTYVCGRSVSLMAFFYLAALVVYASARENGNQLKRHLAVPLLWLLALAVKETAVTLVLALLVWEWSLGTRWRQIWQRQWSLWLLSLAVVAFFLFNTHYQAHMQRSAELNSLTGNLATQTQGLAYLLRQWGWPLWLNIDPDLPVLSSPAAAALALAGLLATLWLTIWVRPRRPWLSLAWSWAVIHLLLLYLVLPRLDVANDRQLYLAAWPLAMALVVELTLRLEPHTFRGLLAALVLCLGGLTVARNQDYRHEISLWESTVPLSPNKARVHNNLGYAYMLAGRVDEARREYTHALRLDPQHIKARYNLERLD
ncbi:tetratricopeptide repeat protein, partial [Rhodoferax sp.]|uniref:tetratricopeptide repeat protein n=1 Tax=Rhodoferax sp. TaxID=50421 RepID=UPI00263101AC